MSFARQLYAIEGRVPTSRFTEADVRRMYPSVEPARLGEVTALINKAHFLLETQAALERLERPPLLKEVYARILKSYQEQVCLAWQDLDTQVHPEHWQSMAALGKRCPITNQDDRQAAHQALWDLLLERGILRSQMNLSNSLW